MAKQPPANTGLRLPPFAKTELTNVLDALKAKGYGANQHDLVGVLVTRVREAIEADEAELHRLAAEMRARREQSRAVGY